jgi:hypothetical protein
VSRHDNWLARLAQQASGYHVSRSIFFISEKPMLACADFGEANEHVADLHGKSAGQEIPCQGSALLPELGCWDLPTDRSHHTRRTHTEIKFIAKGVYRTLSTFLSLLIFYFSHNSRYNLLTLVHVYIGSDQTDLAWISDLHVHVRATIRLGNYSYLDTDPSRT